MVRFSRTSALTRRTLLLVGAAAACALIVGAAAPVRAVDRYLEDVRVSLLSSPAPQSDAIVIVAIDEAALAALEYVSPINRNVVARLLASIDEAAPRAIGVDILLDRRSDPRADAALAAALEAARAPVVAVVNPGGEAASSHCGGPPIRSGTRAARNDAPTGRDATLLALYEPLAISAHGLLCLDRVDGVARRMRFEPVGAFPAFAAALAGVSGIDAPRGRVALDYRLTAEDATPFMTIAASALGDVPLAARKALFADKFVLIGGVSPYGADWRETPLRFADIAWPLAFDVAPPSGALPGVTVHAYALQTALTGRTGARAGAWARAGGALLGAALGCVIGTWRAPVAANAVVGVIGLAAVFGGAFVAYAGVGLMIPIAETALGLGGAAFGALADRARRERRARLEIRNAFNRFLAPAVVSRLEQDPDRLRRPAEQRDVTALFTDLEDFTAMIDRSSPEDAASILNAYLDDVVEAIVTNGGLVDKIVGDAVHALFSVPDALADHRACAARAALAVLERTERRRAGLAANGVALGRTRIGVNSGPALVGNFGGARRLDYTAHGSTVNLAARLEAANKTLGSAICVGEAALSSGDPALCYRPLGPVAVSGLNGPVFVFALSRTGRSNETPATDCAAALDAIARDPVAGGAELDRLAALYPDDFWPKAQRLRLTATGNVIRVG